MTKERIPLVGLPINQQIEYIRGTKRYSLRKIAEVCGMSCDSYKKLMRTGDGKFSDIVRILNRLGYSFFIIPSTAKVPKAQVDKTMEIERQVKRQRSMRIAKETGRKKELRKLIKEIEEENNFLNF